MKILSEVALKMQTILTETANQLAIDTSLIKRQRKLSGASFAQALVFGWLSNPDATYEDLAQSAAAIGVAVTPEAIFHRFTPEACQFFQRLLDASVETMIRSEPVAIELLSRFEGGYLLDSSIVTLPDELASVWEGCGGQEKNTQASMKLSVCWEMRRGEIRINLEDGRSQDKSSPLATQSVGARGMRIADLGYFSLSRLAEMGLDGSDWLTRVSAKKRAKT
jgi:hypothetical protein